MLKLEHHTAEFYQNLASLFYAVAAVDGKIMLQEKYRIKELVDEDWSFKSENWDSQEIIFSTLRNLIVDEYDKEKAFLNFYEFFLANKSNFSTKIRNKILDTSDKIAVSFAGRNKSESVLISRLYFLMRK